MTSEFGVVILATLAFWLFGGVAPRVAGAAIVVVVAAGLASTGDGNGVPLIVLGAAVWLLGHLHFRVRHGAFKSVLAECVCLSLAAASRRGWQVGVALVGGNEARARRAGALEPNEQSERRSQ